MRMKQYLTNTDYSLWQVILNGDGPIQVTTDEKGRLFLKQQFENFFVSDTKGLDKAYDRFQKLISLLEVHGAAVPNEDANQKFLRALPSSWNNVALIMRNKDGIDDLDIDDLYNNLKVFEADIKGSSGSSSNSQNVAFLSAKDTSSSNEVNTANSVSTASGHNSQGQASSSSYTDDLMFSFFANQSNSPQLDDEDLEQIDHDDLEEMDLKWAGFPAQSVGSSNTDVLDLPCLLVLITGTSQSRQHVDTSLIHIESRKSPTAVLFDDDTGRISIRHCEY
ncbi:hypothetical protein Tco_0450668 [Tanacetum coccineum]